MERSRAAILISCVLGITIITVAAVATGHNSVLVTGATAAMVAIGTGAGFYYKGRKDEATAVQRMMFTQGSPPDAKSSSDDDGQSPTKA